MLNAFLLRHIERLTKSFRVSVCLNTEESNIPVLLPPEVALTTVEIRREISLWHDGIALLRLWRIYRRGQFSAVFTLTPKGGLLGMLAAFFAHVPVRVHCFTGQVWANKEGMSRFFLKIVDRAIVLCSTHLLADSPSQREFLIEQGIVPASSIGVLGQGSISGVDVDKFHPDEACRDEIRERMGIPQSSICLLYAGRMKKEKGILDLLQAFEVLRTEHPNLHLILVGPDEENLLPKDGRAGIYATGYSNQVEQYMAAVDIFCLPSYREGFGSVLIEAASCGLPTVASRIYGITDAVVDGVTGLLHIPGDVDGLVECLKSLISDASLRKEMGRAGRLRATQDFSAGKLETHLHDYFSQRISEI